MHDVIINIPSIEDQRKFVHERSVKEAVKTLKRNLSAPVITSELFIDETLYSPSHLLPENKGFESPHPDIVNAYFFQFQSHFKDYESDQNLAHLLGFRTDRQVKAYKSGAQEVPYSVWRKFLILTGRVTQDVYPVLAIMQ